MNQINQYLQLATNSKNTATFSVVSKGAGGVKAFDSKNSANVYTDIIEGKAELIAGYKVGDSRYQLVLRVDETSKPYVLISKY